MKKFTFMLIALLCAMVTFANGPKRQFDALNQLPVKQLQIGSKMNAKQAPQGLVKKALKATAKARAPKKAPSSIDLTGDYTWDYLQADEYVVDLSEVEATAGSSHVVISESVTTEGGFTIKGMFDNAIEATIESNEDGNYLVIESEQTIGTLSTYGDYALYGLFYYEGDDEYEAGWYFSDVYGEITADGIIFDEDIWFVGRLTSGSYAGYLVYPYWVPGSTLTPADPLTPVVAPQDLVTEEYSLTARNYEDKEDVSGAVQIGFDGKDVYMQGLCTYLPEAWVKGTLDGKTITFATGQYFGIFADTYDMFLNVLMGEDVVFDYDAEAGTLTAQNEFFLVDNSQYYFDSYRGCVIKKVVEKAAMPANPEITKLEDSNYGWRFYFNVPIVDINGDGLVTSKLSYMIYTDIEGKIAPLTFTPATHTRLTEDMTEFPYGFTEDYDIYVNRIYLNELYSADWNNLGIKSIYRGGGEENATEIQWYHIKDYSGGDGIFNFNALTEKEQPVSTTNTHDGDIPEEGQVLKSGAVSLTVSASTTSTPNRYWMATEYGIQLRIYGGTLTFEVPEGYTITAIDCNAPTWNDKNTFDPESEKIEEEVPAPHYLWAGSAEKVTLTVNGKTFFNSIVVTVEGGDEPGPEEEAIDPEGKTYTFDDSDMEGWTTIDADGDGYDWVLGSAVGGIYLSAGNDLAGNGHGSSADFVVSGSYSNVTGALKPDNYFVSPKVKLGSTFSFFAAAQDAGYPEEHFGVFVSTKGKNVGDFEKMDEWTLTKVRAEKVSASVSEAFGSSTKGQGRWYQYIVDMSSYKGQEGYVAIRHFDCTDQFLMLVDDITFGTPADPDPEPENNLVELPEGVEAESWTIEGVYYSSYASDKQFATGVAFDGNDIYVQGLAYYFPEAWVKGTIADGIATFPTGQFVGEDDYGTEYIIGVDEKYAISDFQYAYDAKAKTLTQMTPFVAENADTADEIDPWGYWLYSYLYEGEPVVLNPVEAPESLETESYYFKALMSVETEDEDGETVYEEEEYTSDVLVGFDGDDVYIQGLAGDYPEGWVKATKNEAGQYVIPANQYMGTLEYYIYEFMYYFAALNEDLEPEDVVLTFDEATNTFSTDQIVMLNGSRFIVYPYLTYEEVDITKIVEMAGTPVDPSFTDYTLEGTNYPNVNFNIPIIDTDGNPLLPSKLFYTVWVEKDGQQMPYTVLADEYKYVEEDMVEIPYSYNDGYDIYKGGKTFYFNPVDEVAEFTNIGVQSIYYGGNECNKTDIIWLDGTVTTGIKDINTANNTAVYYDLQGRKVTASQKGLLIKQSRQDNGTITTVKVVRK